MPKVQVPPWMRDASSKFHGELTRDNLPKRVGKSALATTITIVIMLLPNIRNSVGRAGYLACITCVFVFGHPGRRVGAMIEALCLTTLGASLGVAWASVGTRLSVLVYQHNTSAGMAIKGIFLTIACFSHGYIRSSTPRLFLMVLLMIIPVLIGLTSPEVEFSAAFPKQFYFPILIAISVLLLVSVAIFPEFGSTHLGRSTIEVLQKSKHAQKAAGDLFIMYSSHGNSADYILQLKGITTIKTELAKQLAECRSAFTECKGITGLVAKIISLIGACESEYSLLGIDQSASAEVLQEVGGGDLDRLKSRRAVESGNGQLLKALVKRIEVPVKSLQSTISRTLDIVSTCVAFTYDVPDFCVGEGTEEHGKTRRPAGILVAEIDVHMEWLQNAINEFGKTSSDALEGAAELSSEMEVELDLMPREEVFLISSFVMNLRHAASHSLDMLIYCKELIRLRDERHARRSVHLPRIKLKKWLFSGNEEPEVLAPASKGGVYKGREDKEVKQKRPLYREKRRRNVAQIIQKHVIRGTISARKIFGGIFDWLVNSEANLYAFKFTIGVMLLSWPAFLADWVHWYTSARGVWAPLIFVLVFENAVGSTIWIFVLRSVGTVVGSLWGFAAFEAGNGNEFVIAVMLAIATIPNFYVQLGTKYQKAGMVCTISMCVVAISTHMQTVEGTSAENFYKRVTTMFIGGAVATLVQLLIYPVKARSSLRGSLATAVVQINRMESFIALGVDETRNFTISPLLFKRFEKTRKKTVAALESADAFLEATKREPRMKGSFDTQALVYKDIIFVLGQIAERMENMLQLRQAYGSAVLEQYNTIVFNYRRNVAAAITLTLYVIHEALTTKASLPQFLPSARLAHQRMVVRVRQILVDGDIAGATSDRSTENEETTQRALRLKFLSWNASSAALEECIEYIEELTELAKTLVGVNNFRSGILHQPNYLDYKEQVKKRGMGAPHQMRQYDDTLDAPSETTCVTATTGIDELPTSLNRIQSRRMEARLGRRRTTISLTMLVQ